MAFDAARSTLTIATMIGAAAKERAGELAGGVLEIPGVGPSALKALELGGQASALVEELTALLSTNRSAITDVLRAEIGLQLQRVGLSTPDPADSSRAEIDRLKAEVADLRQALEASSASATRTAANARSLADIPTAAKLGPARRTPAAVKKSAAIKKSTTQPTAAKTAVKKSATSKTAASKTAAKKPVRATSVPKKSVAKKAAVKSAAVPAPATQKPAAQKVSAQTPAIGNAPAVAPAPAVTAISERTVTSYADLENHA